MYDKTKNLIGYDEHGRLVDEGNSIHRIITPSYLTSALEIFELYKINNLSKFGIVETNWSDVGNFFIHKKYIISYPYEWPTEMYKDAVLFHLNLLLELDKLNLSLKDILLTNIVFDSTRPVFVDFLSIIKTINISKEKWLVEGFPLNEKRFAAIEKMFIPFLFVPLLKMESKDFAEARKMLSVKACNMGNGQPELSEVFYWKRHSVKEYLKNPKMIVKDIVYYQMKKKEINEIIYSFKQETNYSDYIHKLNELIKKIEVTPPAGAYQEYYSQKKESFNFSSQESWGNKQRNVFNVLKKECPVTVLDIGANTGWFSFLAEHLGSSVISLEIEEDCINAIYRQSKKGNNKILPLLISFDDLSKSYFGSVPSGADYSERDFKNEPLFIAPLKRFHVDLVLCLGLIHHLVLGMGKEIDEVLKILSKISRKSLLLEFVSLNDPLIVNEPTFFQNLHKYNKNNYSLEEVIMIGKKYFLSVEILTSHPESRNLILFKKN